jgi:uncharacterized protein (DUF433 family)
MAHQMFIAVPDEQYQELATLAARPGMTPEALAAAWLVERQHQEAALQEVYPGIVSDPQIHQGEPVIKGTRIQAALIAELMANGASADEISEDYHLNADQIQAAIAYFGNQGAGPHGKP